MGSLLDQVLDNRDNPTADSLLSPTDDKPHQLPNGSVIYDSTIAAVNRILELNPHLHKRATGTYSSPYQLYNGFSPVDLTDKYTFLSLIKADFIPKTPFQAALVRELVEEYAPVLSWDKVVVSDNLIWDRKTGKLLPLSDDDRICTVS